MSMLKQLRDTIGVSAYQVAARAGISPSRYSYLERSIELPTQQEADQLAKAFSALLTEAKQRLDGVEPVRLRESLEIGPRD